MILADTIGTVIHTLDGGKLFRASVLLLRLFVCAVSIRLHHMQSTAEPVVCRQKLCSSAINPMCLFDNSFMTWPLFSVTAFHLSVIRIIPLILYI